MAVLSAVAWVVALGGAGAAAVQQPAFTSVAGSPFSTNPPDGQNALYPFQAAFSPDGGLLATPNGRSSTVSVFGVGAGGALRPVAGSPFPTNQPVVAPPSASPIFLAFSPGGGLLATANAEGSDTVSVFRVEAGGALSPAAGSPVAITAAHSPASPYGVAFSPSGGLLAVTSYRGETVSMFQVGAGGALTPVTGSPFATAPRPAGTFNAPYALAFSPGGGLLAVTNSFASTVSVLRVGPGGGLTPVAGSPFAIGGFPLSVAFSPGGGLLATANLNSNTVSVFRVETDGALTQVHGSPFSTNPPDGQNARGPHLVAFSPGGGLLAVTNVFSNTVSVFGVGAGGALTPVAGSPFAITGPSELAAISPAWGAFSPRGGLLAFANAGSNTVSVLGPTGVFVIDKSAEPARVPPGGVVSYKLTVHNPSAQEATGTVSDDLSGVLDKASYRDDATASTGSVVVHTALRRLIWEGSLGAGQTATITYSVRVHGDARGFLSNSVEGPPGSGCKPPAPASLPCVTHSEVVPPPGAAHLVLSKTASTQSAHRGGQVTYTLAVRNHGPDRATGVTVQDPMPTGLFFQSAVPSQGSCSITAGGLTCHLGTLPAGGGALVQAIGTVALNASGSIVNAASVWADQDNHRPGDGFASTPITVIPPAPWPVSRLVVTKRVDRRTAVQGERLDYTVRVTNHGPDTANELRLTDKSRLPLRIVSIRPGHGRCVARPSFSCELGRLRAGASVTIRITAIAAAAGRQVNTAAAVSSSWNTDLAGGVAAARTTIRRAPTPHPRPRHRRRRLPPFTG